MSEPFIAEVKIFAGNFAPRGFAFCDGQLLPISQNTALFSLIGTTYGGDGRTTTALPNLQSRIPVHAGQGPGLTRRRLGERGGAETVTLTASQLPSHTHSLLGSTDAADSAEPEDKLVGTTDFNRFFGGVAGSTTNMHPEAVSSFGTDESSSHDNLQPFLTLNFIIALVGLYPSRS